MPADGFSARFLSDGAAECAFSFLRGRYDARFHTDGYPCLPTVSARGSFRTVRRSARFRFCGDSTMHTSPPPRHTAPPPGTPPLRRAHRPPGHPPSAGHGKLFL